jgi:hypothetical protein
MARLPTAHGAGSDVENLSEFSPGKTKGRARGAQFFRGHNDVGQLAIPVWVRRGIGHYALLGEKKEALGAPLDVSVRQDP